MLASTTQNIKAVSYKGLMVGWVLWFLIVMIIVLLAERQELKMKIRRMENEPGGQPAKAGDI